MLTFYCKQGENSFLGKGALIFQSMLNCVLRGEINTEAKVTATIAAKTLHLAPGGQPTDIGVELLRCCIHKLTACLSVCLSECLVAHSMFLLLVTFVSA